MASGRKTGVIGWPVGHSLSPRLHRFWLKKHRIDAEYEALEIPPERLAETVKSLPIQGYVGFNLTVPHKEAVLSLLDEIDNVARAIGAVNTVVIDEGKLKGTNTDAYGFIANLRQNAFPKAKNKAVILGAGGAARAIVKALLGEGFGRIVIANRSADKAEAIARQFGKKIQTASWGERNAALADADLLVNATSLGMQGKDALEMDLSSLPKSAVVTDIVYVPLDTELLVQAKARGHKTVDGLGMLLHQAAPAFEAWFGMRPEVDDALRKHMLDG